MEQQQRRMEWDRPDRARRSGTHPLTPQGRRVRRTSLRPERTSLDMVEATSMQVRLSLEWVNNSNRTHSTHRRRNSTHSQLPRYRGRTLEVKIAGRCLTTKQQ